MCDQCASECEICGLRCGTICLAALYNNWVTISIEQLTQCDGQDYEYCGYFAPPLPFRAFC